jgi:hypothetical protein
MNTLFHKLINEANKKAQPTEAKPKRRAIDVIGKIPVFTNTSSRLEDAQFRGKIQLLRMRLGSR